MLSFLPHPKKLNLDISNRYPESFREKIVENLNRSTGLSNYQVIIIAIDKLKLHIKELEVSILNEIIDHTKNKVVPELFSFCDNYVMARLKSENIATVINAVNSFKDSLLDIFDNHDLLIFIQKLEDFESSNNIRLNKKILVDACKYAEMVRKIFSNPFTEIDLDNWRNTIKAQINEKLSRLLSISQSSILNMITTAPIIMNLMYMLVVGIQINGLGKIIITFLHISKYIIQHIDM